MNSIACHLIAVTVLGSFSLAVPAADSPLYFPPDAAEWETIEPSAAGWDKSKLQEALDYAGQNQTSGMVMIQGGRILAEQYWEVKGARGAKYRQRISGRDKAGRPIEDVASAQKSVASILVGIAREKGLLKIEDSVTSYLGEGWSKAAPHQENAITIRHLITMTSGLTGRGTFEARAGTKWRYNTWAYAKSMDVLEKAAGMNRHQLTRKWLTEPTGMTDSRWVPRGSPELQAINGFGFATSARDLARFGLMVLARGQWGGRPILSDQAYLRDSTMTSQRLNPYYGYLWWINSDGGATGNPPRITTAPKDMFSANGALNRRCWIVPSLRLVVTRLGDQPDAGRAFDTEFWKLLMAAAK